MAVVPRAPIPGPAGGGNGITVPRLSPAMFGGEEEATAALSGLAKEAGAVFEQHLQAANQAQTADNLSQLAAEETRLRSNLQQIEGKDALEAHQKTVLDFDTFSKKLADGTRNQAVQRSTLAHAEQYRNSLDSWGRNYATGQFKKYDADSVNASVVNEQNAAISDGSSERVRLALDRQKAILTDYGQNRAGWSPEQLQLETAKAVSDTHYGVLNMISAGKNDLAAKAYYEAHKDEFVGAQRINAEKMVQEGSTRGEAYRELDKIFKPKQTVTKTGDMSWRVDEVPAVTTMTEVLALTKDIKDVGVRHMVEGLARQRFNDEKVAEAQRDEALFDRVYRDVQKNPGVAPRGLATSAEWVSLSPKSKAALEKLAEDIPFTEPQATVDLMALRPEVLAGYSDSRMLQEFGSRMTPTDFKEAKHRRDVFRKGGDEYKSTLSNDEMLVGGLRQIGMGGITKDDTLKSIGENKTKAVALEKFKIQVEQIRATYKNSGVKIDDDLYQKIVDKAAFQMSQKVTVLSARTPGSIQVRSEATIAQLMENPDLMKHEMEMPREFVQGLYGRAYGRPGTMAKGATMGDWIEKDGDAIRRAFVAVKLGASADEAFAVYLRGK